MTKRSPKADTLGVSHELQETLSQNSPHPSVKVIIYLDQESDAEKELFLKMMAAIQLKDEHWLLWSKVPDREEMLHLPVLIFGSGPKEMNFKRKIFFVPLLSEIEYAIDAKRKAWNTLKELSKDFWSR